MLIKNRHFRLINILTLNHDILIEHFLEHSKIRFTDGFRIKTKMFPQWDKDLLKEKYYRINPFRSKDLNFRVKLYKLHGSVNWFSIGDNEGYINIYKLPTDQYVETVHEIDKTLLHSEGLPNMLIGTFNKLQEYLSFIYEDLYQASQTAIEQCENIIISGYSFNDKGINSNLVKWLLLDHSKRIIIIHPDFEDLRRKARGAYNKFIYPIPGPTINPKLRIIEKKFEDVTYEELILKIQE
jgi:hypothetical protein